MEVFARITKVDERTRTVTGRAVQEMVDRSGEIFDYKTSKPEFQRWSAEVSADTGGKSLGNIRSMHGNVAAGKVIDIEFNDVEKAIDITAKIVDDDEWQKCVEGVHAGFSIGGTYKNRTPEVQNGRMVTRYTAVPAEISLVDRPCVPSAKFFDVSKAGFSLIKRNGQMVKRRFSRTSMDMQSMAKAVASGMALAGALPGGDLRMIKAIHARGPRPFNPASLRKDVAGPFVHDVKRPPNSSNGQWDNEVHADTGAGNNWRDHPAPTDKPTRWPFQVVGTPNQSNRDAALDAIKRDLARGAKRM